MAKYEEWLSKEKIALVEAWARDGLTNEQIAKNMGITRETLNQWCKKYPDISDSLKRGKEVVDIEVENALYKRAIGYRYEEKVQELVEGKLTTTKIIDKEVAPDVTAQIFWLKNRKPELWRDKRDIELSGEIGLADELKKARERVENAKG